MIVLYSINTGQLEHLNEYNDDGDSNINSRSSVMMSFIVIVKLLR